MTLQIGMANRAAGCSTSTPTRPLQRVLMARIRLIGRDAILQDGVSVWLIAVTAPPSNNGSATTLRGVSRQTSASELANMVHPRVDGVDAVTHSMTSTPLVSSAHKPLSTGW